MRGDFSCISRVFHVSVEGATWDASYSDGLMQRRRVSLNKTSINQNKST